MKSGRSDEAGRDGGERVGLGAGIAARPAACRAALDCWALEGALWSAPVAIAMEDLQGRLIFANPAFADL